MTETAVCVHCKKSVTRETVWIDDDEDIYSSIICAGREDGVGHEPSPAVPRCEHGKPKSEAVPAANALPYAANDPRQLPLAPVAQTVCGYWIGNIWCGPGGAVPAQPKIEIERLIVDTTDSLQERIARAEATIAELELKYRKLMWLSHGHLGIYGDDGEMQCSACIRYGCPDYKRQPIKDVEFAYELARQERRATGKEPR